MADLFKIIDNNIDILRYTFSFGFMQRAIIVGLLVSLCASLLGVSLVLKRYSMIGDGLSHVSFGALALGTLLGVTNQLAFSIPIVIAAAFLLLKLSESSKIKGDAAIALVSTAALALGVIFLSYSTGMNTDVCNYMFGSMYALKDSDVTISIILCITVIIVFVLFYNKIFAVTFDESFAKATGIKVQIYNILIAFLTAVTIVLGMRMMGALLISSLIVFPAITAMRLFSRFRQVTICAAIISIVCFIIGVVISVLFNTPSGASVVCTNIVMLLVFSAIARIKKAE